MAIRLASLALALSLLALVALLTVPGLNELAIHASAFHFYVVSAASLLAAALCVVLVLSPRSLPQTRILFLALCFFSLGLIFSIHGLTTPGHLFHHASASLQRSPY